MFGYDLYLSSNDMQLSVAVIREYIRLFVQLTLDMRLGHNPDMNTKLVPHP